ncbi:MAG: hypothetical protein EPN68_12960 [Rhodanobacter sp.]|nr:MAG: hypothetical protein EPN68_12960 [Rhodanobacter sp.]
MKIIAISVFLLFASFAAPAHATASDGAVTAVALEQGTCSFWGDCAHYMVAVNSDGTGSYIGLEVAKTKGGVALKVPKSSFTAIVQQLDKMKYFTLRDSYTSKDDGCKELHTDQTSVTFYAVRSGKTKRIEVYWGCVLPGVTNQFEELAGLINKLSGASALLGSGGGK